MSERAQQAFDAWKQADGQARGAENELTRAWELYFARRTEPPPRELVREVSCLRAVANERLTAVMQALGVKRGDGAPSGTRSERPAA